MVNFLKASKYLSVGKWEICDCISVVSKDEIWKHFSPKKELSLFSEVFLVFITWYSSVNTHTLLLYFSMTQLAVKKNQHLSDTQRRWFFGRVGFSVYILTFCYCSAHVTKIVEVRASWPLSHFCIHLSFSFLASPAWWNLRPRRTGTGSRSPPLQTQCGVQHVFVKLTRALHFLPLIYPTPTTWARSLTILSLSWGNGLRASAPPPCLRATPLCRKCCVHYVPELRGVHCSFLTRWILLFGWCSKGFIKWAPPTSPVLRPTPACTIHQL